MESKNPTTTKESGVSVVTVTPNGQILYDVGSILKTEVAKHHFQDLERLLRDGKIKKTSDR